MNLNPRALFLCFFLSVQILSVQSIAEENKSEKKASGFIGRFIHIVKERLKPEAIEFEESRRSFIKKSTGAGVGAAVMMSGGGGAIATILNQTHKKLPKETLRKIARMRLKGGSLVSLDASGLNTYRAALLRTASEHSHEGVRAVAKERLLQINNTFENKELIEAITDSRRVLNKSDLFLDPVQRQRLQRKLQKAQTALLENGKVQSLELSVLTARTLLDHILIKKMAYQIQFVNPGKNQFAVIFTKKELQAVQEYRTLIAALENTQINHAGKNNFLSKWLPQLRQEADLALKMYDASVSYAGSCRALLTGS